MKRIAVAPNHAEVFARQGLREFGDFFDISDGQTINRNEKRDVTILRFSQQDSQRVYFRKRFFCPHPKDMLFTFRNFGRLCSQGELEWRCANLLLANGIETYHPAAWGVQTLCGIERRSFFLTEKIDGQSLIEFLLAHWDGFDTPQQEKLVVGLAQLFRTLHQAKISLPDSYLWHLFVLNPVAADKPYRFAIIDLHRMRVNAAAAKHAAHNLGALLFSLPDEWFDSRLRELFLETYLQPSEGFPITDHAVFLAELKKREQTLIARRKKPNLARLQKMV